MSKLRILGIRRVRKDKGFGRLTTTSYVDGKQVSKKTKKYKIVKPTSAEMDPTGGWQGKGRIDFTDKEMSKIHKWFKS